MATDSSRGDAHLRCSAPFAKDEHRSQIPMAECLYSVFAVFHIYHEMILEGYAPDTHIFWSICPRRSGNLTEIQGSITIPQCPSAISKY